MAGSGGGGHVLSFVQAEHVFDGIQNGRVGVAVAIKANFLLIVVDCLEIDDRAVALAVVVSAKPQHDVVRGRREVPPSESAGTLF